jgi:hypothetical protein
MVVIFLLGQLLWLPLLLLLLVLRSLATVSSALLLESSRYPCPFDRRAAS